MRELISVFTNPADAHFWIFIALVVLVAVLWRVKAPGLAVKALDDAAAKVREQLDEAHRLREEAATLLGEIKVKREEGERAAAQMIRDAEQDAQRLREEAAVKLEEDIGRREALAERKIATIEAQAAAEVKAAAAELAAETAEAVLAARIAAAKSDPSIDASLAGLAGRFKAS
ncbi:MAG TPA: ATP F0F1 synthase subunit B [Caulobacteraceae bacterium]|nr:ATP F0F1 synthase subunit B [Caulobacteraceae bacterium]